MDLTIPRPVTEASSIPVVSEPLSQLQFFPTPDSFIEFALDSILNLVQAHAGSLFLWDERKKALVLKTARGPQRQNLNEIHVRLREGISGWVGDQGHSLLVKDIRADDRFSRFSRPGNYESGSFISLPLISSNKLLGVINITERADFRPFTEDDLSKARLFAQHIAIAFENMRISHRLKEENEALNDQVANLRETIRLQEPLVAVGKLASNLAHELNNPLDSIRRYVNLALDHVMDDSLGRQYVLNAKEGVRRAIQVVRGLLQYCREFSKVEPRQAEIHTIIRRSIAAVSKDYPFDNIEIELKLSDKKWAVHDCGLYVVFRNLLKNAHQAMGGRGKLVIRTFEEDGCVVIALKDNGCGMSPQVMNRLFEPFFTTKETEGTGIGLTICRGVIEKCGGSIECESAEGAGTEFVIKLPCKERN